MPDDYDALDNLYLEKKGFKIYAKPASINYTIALSDTVLDDSFEYSDIVYFLSDANVEDIIDIHIGNFGGAVHSGIKLANAVKECKATVNMHVTANCYSMGAILALCGDSLSIRPSLELMFHNYSGGEQGKGAEMKLSVNEFADHFKRLLEYTCYPFLSADEIEDLCDDRDRYIHVWDEDLEARIKRHFKRRKK